MASELGCDIGRILAGMERTGPGGSRTTCSRHDADYQGYLILMLTTDIFLSFWINQPVKDYDRIQG